MAFKPGNVPLNIFRKILIQQGCQLIRHDKGHEKYTRKDFLGPIVIQDHIDPVPQFIVKQAMRVLKLNNREMEKILQNL